MRTLNLAPTRARGAAARLAVLAALALAGPAVATPASAATDPGDGLWYLTRTGVEEAHAQTTGEGITIAVIDGPVNPAAPDLVGANLVVRPSFCHAEDGVTPTATSERPDAEHATGTVALLIGTGAGANGQPGIRGVAPGATVLTYAMNPPDWDTDRARLCYDESGMANDQDVIAQSIDDAVAQGADIISMSTGGTWMPVVGSAVARAYAAGVIIVAAADNDGSASTWPGLGNGVVMVEMSDSAMQLEVQTTSHPYLGVVAPGEDIRWYDSSAGGWDAYRLASGTSMATPWTAGVLALAWSLHPEATGNQMIQALIDTTAVDPGFGHDDEWGYGPVAIHQLLEVDPTQYPDENPVLRPVGMTEDANGLPIVPSTQEVLEAIAATSGSVDGATPTASPEGEPRAAADASSDAPDDEATGTSALPIAIGAAVVLAAAGAAALLLRRRAARSAGSAPPHGG